jgi:hypothetical protein
MTLKGLAVFACYRESGVTVLQCSWLILYCEAGGLCDINIMCGEVNRLHALAFFDQLHKVGATENHSINISYVGLQKA